MELHSSLSQMLIGHVTVVDAASTLPIGWEKWLYTETTAGNHFLSKSDWEHFHCIYQAYTLQDNSRIIIYFDLWQGKVIFHYVVCVMQVFFRQSGSIFQYNWVPRCSRMHEVWVDHVHSSLWYSVIWPYYISIWFWANSLANLSTTLANFKHNSLLNIITSDRRTLCLQWWKCPPRRSKPQCV